MHLLPYIILTISLLEIPHGAVYMPYPAREIHAATHPRGAHGYARRSSWHSLARRCRMARPVAPRAVIGRKPSTTIGVTRTPCQPRRDICNVKMALRVAGS